MTIVYCDSLSSQGKATDVPYSDTCSLNSATKYFNELFLYSNNRSTKYFNDASFKSLFIYSENRKQSGVTSSTACDQSRTTGILLTPLISLKLPVTSLVPANKGMLVITVSSSIRKYLFIQRLIYLTWAPGVTGPVGPMTTREPSAFSADSIMPCDSTPLRRRGGKLAMKHTCLPTRSAGS